MRHRTCRFSPATLALVAACLSLAAWAILGMRLDGYRLYSHPFALPGAHGLPGAGLFNALVFVLPGALMAVLCERLRRRLPPPPGWRLRIGCTLALLAALGWIGQGLWPLDLARIDAAGSRWHALAWSMWWIAAAGAALLLALAAPGLRGWGAVLMAFLILPAALPSGSPLAQPAAVLVWGGWMRAAVRRFTPPATTRSH